MFMCSLATLLMLRAKDDATIAIAGLLALGGIGEVFAELALIAAIIGL